ncbi:MAG: hypothetical protein JW776_08895 [Candidatus Lokiarchaeota archaeon]|nr:hypothetical protein [Candidatus Lokiarchaeota archaeon]
MKDWKLWKLIVLLFGSYFGLNAIFGFILYTATGNIGDLFGSSDSFRLWIDMILAPTLAAPGIKLLETGWEASIDAFFATLLNLLYFIPGIVSAILIGFFAKNSKIAFRIVFFFFILLTLLNVGLYFTGAVFWSLAWVYDYLSLPLPVAIQWIIFSGLIHSIFHGGIAGQIRNLMRRKQL